MMEKPKKLFAFKYKLSLLLVVVVLLVATLLGLWQLFMTNKTLEENFEQNKQLVSDRALAHVGDVDRMYLLIEKPLVAESEEILQKVSKKYDETGNVDFDLSSFIVEKSGFNLYVIDTNNIIIRGTDATDIGLNFALWSDFVKTLDKIRAKKAFYSDRIDVSVRKSEMHKYAYLPSNDGKYVFEVGVQMDQYNEALRGCGFDKIGVDIAGKFDFVNSVVMYNYEGKGYVSNSTGAATISAAHKPYFEEAMSTMKTVEVEGEQAGHPVIYRYVPYQIMDAVGYNQKNVIEIVYDQEWLRENLKKNIINIVGFITGGSIVAVLLGIYVGGKLTQPIEKFTVATQQLAVGNFNVHTDVRSNDEFKILSHYFDNMASSVRDFLEERYRYEKRLKKKNKEIYTQKEEITSLYEETTAMNEELENLLTENENGYFETVRALANAVEAKDAYTGGHCERVMEYSLGIAETMKVGYQEIRDLRFGSILHDVGKIGIAEEILNKSGKYTSEEYEIMKRHPLIGYEILEEVHFLERGRRIVLEHHEWMDGKGYPRGIKGEDIDLLSRIVCVADAYDAMTSNRPYRHRTFSQQEAINELIANKGSQFDPKVVDAFIVWLESPLNKS